MKARILICMMALLVVALVVAGCVTGTDPNTGAATYHVDPNAVAKIEPTIETAITIGTLLAPLFPVIIPALTLITGGFGIWLKMKPKVTKAQDRATLLHTGVSSLVVAIEELKKISPDGWEKLKTEIKVGPEIENIIRAIRGLPAKT